MANPVPGELGGVVGLGKESTLGTWAASTDWLYPDGDGFDINLTDVTTTQKDVHSASRATGRINAPTGLRQHGTLKWTGGADHGLILSYAGFGAQAGVSALSADTIKSATPIVTASGISTATLTNSGAQTYVLGSWLRVNTSTSAEWRQIQTLAANGATSTVATLGQYITNAAAAAGTAAQVDAYLKFTTNPTGLTLPSLSMEANFGNYSKQVPGWLVDQLDINVTNAEVTMTATVESASPVYATLSSPTTPAPSAGVLADLTSPFVRPNGSYVVYANPLQAGGSTAAPAALQMKDVTAVSLSWKNNLKHYDTHNGTLLGRLVPGKQELTGSYTFITLEDDMNEFNTYLNSLIGSTIPLTFGWANNQAGSGAAVGRAYGIYVPQAQLLTASYPVKVGDANMVTITWKAKPAGATSDLCQVFVASSKGSTTF